MPSNSPEYAKAYYLKKRAELYTTLGGKCFVCGKRKNLIVHRIHRIPRTWGPRVKSQQIPSVILSDHAAFNQTTENAIRARKKALYVNTDNMVLLCAMCYKYAIEVYGRKKVIGRRQLYELRPG